MNFPDLYFLVLARDPWYLVIIVEILEINMLMVCSFSLWWVSLSTKILYFCMPMNIVRVRFRLVLSHHPFLFIGLYLLELSSFNSLNSPYLWILYSKPLSYCIPFNPHVLIHSCLSCLRLCPPLLLSTPAISLNRYLVVFVPSCYVDFFWLDSMGVEGDIILSYIRSQKFIQFQVECLNKHKNSSHF